MNKHPDSDYIGLGIMRLNAEDVEEGDSAALVLLCIAFLMVLCSLTAYWWQQ